MHYLMSLHKNSMKKIQKDLKKWRAYDVQDITQAYLDLKLVEKATAFLDEAAQNIDDEKKIAELQKHIKEVK